MSNQRMISKNEVKFAGEDQKLSFGLCDVYKTC